MSSGRHRNVGDHCVRRADVVLMVVPGECKANVIVEGALVSKQSLYSNRIEYEALLAAKDFGTALTRRTYCTFKSCSCFESKLC